MNEKAIFAEDAFDVSLDEPNSTEYANPVDLKWRQHPSVSGSVRWRHEISVALAGKRQVNEFLFLFYYYFFFFTKFFCNLLMMNCNLKSPNLKQGNLAIVKSFEAEFSSLSPSSERMEELWVVWVSICRNAIYGDVEKGRNKKCLATDLDASLSFLSTSRRCSWNRSPSRLPISQMYNF